MEQKDYLMRYFEQMGIVLAALLGFRKKGDGSGGLEVINEALKEFTNMDSQEINSIPEDHLLDELTSKRNLLPDQIKFIAEMLFQEGEFYGIENKPGKGLQSYRKAYLLLRHVDANEQTWSQERTDKMRYLQSKIDHG